MLEVLACGSLLASLSQVAAQQVPSCFLCPRLLQTIGLTRVMKYTDSQLDGLARKHELELIRRCESEGGMVQVLLNPAADLLAAPDIPCCPSVTPPQVPGRDAQGDGRGAECHEPAGQVRPAARRDTAGPPGIIYQGGGAQGQIKVELLHGRTPSWAACLVLQWDQSQCQ